MKKFELYKLSFRLAKRKYNILPILGIAAAAVCLITAAKGYLEVQEQKARPFELIATGSDIQNEPIRTISKFDTVLRATAVFPVSATMIADQYSANVVLNGVSASYLNKNFEKGDVFPDNTVMPYIVLNNAAVKQFLDKDNKAVPKGKNIDWLSRTILLQLGGKDGKTVPKDKNTEGKDSKAAPEDKNTEGKAGKSVSEDKSTDRLSRTTVQQLEGQVTAKICGILEDDSEIPQAYISLSSAKALAAADYTEIRIQLKNAGSEPAASKKLSSLGLQVKNADKDLLSEWEKTETSSRFFFSEGLVALICTFAILQKNKQIEHGQNSKQYEMLRFIGVSQKNIRLIFIYMDAFVISTGVALGIIINLLFHAS